jgi:hypothetical protein
VISVSELFFEGFVLENVFGFFRFVICEFLVFFLESFIFIVELMKFRDMRLFSHASLGFNHFILLEITKILKWLGYFLVREFVFELISI